MNEILWCMLLQQGIDSWYPNNQKPPRTSIVVHSVHNGRISYELRYKNEVVFGKIENINPERVQSTAQAALVKSLQKLHRGVLTK